MKTRAAANPFARPSIAKATFLETPEFRAVYNIAPVLPGHSLVIPKRPVRSILALSNNELVKFIATARQATQILCSAFGTKDFNWTLQEGKLAGQTIPHLHLHIIPRQKRDLARPGDWYPLLKKQAAGSIDSKSRNRLSARQLDDIVLHLRGEAKKVAVKKKRPAA